MFLYSRLNVISFTLPVSCSQKLSWNNQHEPHLRAATSSTQPKYMRIKGKVCDTIVLEKVLQPSQSYLKGKEPVGTVALMCNNSFIAIFICSTILSQHFIYNISLPYD